MRKDFFCNTCDKCNSRRHLILSCQGDLAIFPFDDPVCTFSIESSEFRRLSLLIDFLYQIEQIVMPLGSANLLVRLKSYTCVNIHS
jgi:hypothetical protein